MYRQLVSFALISRHNPVGEGSPAIRYLIFSFPFDMSVNACYSPGATKPDKVSLSCAANECSNGGVGDLDLLPTHETCPYLEVEMLEMYCLGRLNPL